MQIRHRIAAAPALVFMLAVSAFAQADSSAYAALRWRLIGPFRAGRVTAVSGVPGDPSVYYIATPNGGIWKMTDGGREARWISPSIPGGGSGVVVNFLPAQTLYTSAREQCADLKEALARWQDLNQHDIPAINRLLHKSGKTALPLATAPLSGCIP